MKENRYDDQVFYDKYAAFPRSVHGLNAAGEWKALQAMLPVLTGKRVLDLGCGFGWHCAYASDMGAEFVLGTDISRKMLLGAAERNARPNVEYRLMAMEDMDFDAEFDVVISSLAIHYIDRFDALCKNVCRALRGGGSFIYSAEHPIFTAHGPQQWYTENGNKLHWPVDDYFTEGWRQAGFLGEKVNKHHITLTTHINSLLDAGFAITGLQEPQPPQELLFQSAEMADELRRPMMIIISAQKR